MKNLLIIVLFALGFPFLAHSQSWKWGANGSSIETNDIGSPVATDKNGNVYITGDYADLITFGTLSLSCFEQNSYLVKYDSSGNLLWAVQPTEGSNSDVITGAVATDATGDIYITGTFYGQVTFGSYVLSNSSHESVFLVKYSPSDSVIWAKKAPASGASAFAIGTSLAIDKTGNIFITGYFEGSLIFGTDTLVYQSMYNNAMFIAKYDSAGNVQWAKQSNSKSVFGEISPNSVATDNLGNAYITGTFLDTVSFDTDSLIGATYLTFLVKYTPAGNFSWVKESEIVSLDAFTWGNAVITDRANNIYITGYFDDKVRFDSKSLYSPSAYSAYFTKYDSNGNILWAKQSSAGWQGTGFASDKYSNIYMSGISYENDDTLRFGSYTLTTGPWVAYASFLMKFDTSGNPICGSMLENLSNLSNSEIASDSSGNYIYVAGTFENDTIICGSDTSISTNSDDDNFVGRWLNCSLASGVNNITPVNSVISIFPNPNNGNFELIVNNLSSDIGKMQVEIYNVTGERVYSSSDFQSPRFKINLSVQPAGIYCYRVTEEGGKEIGSGKFIIEK